MGSLDWGLLDSSGFRIDEGRLEGAAEAVGASTGGNVVGPLVGFADGEKDQAGCRDIKGAILGTSDSNE